MTVNDVSVDYTKVGIIKDNFSPLFKWTFLFTRDCQPVNAKPA